MELYQLRSFAAVAELGNLTRAAERLHLSQPAVSAHIKALEEELEVVLFERGPGGMALTAAGRLLLHEAENVMTAAQQLRSRALTLRGQVVGHIRLGTLTDPEFIRLGDLLARAFERSPLVTIELHHEVTGTALDKVRDGELDATFYYGERAHPAVAALPLREIAFRVAAPAAWRDRIDGAIWETLAALPWIMTPPISSHFAIATSLFRARGAAPSTLVEADNESVIRSLVASGLGLALVREDLGLADQAAGSICLWGDVRLPTTLSFLYPKEREPEPALAALVELVQDLWHAAPASRSPAAARPAGAGA
ncbi:MAG TPA: LysR family transcriptional regulator [Casimicrobiaceae bacterium]|nr:LysR family transcriptional regulator [Casimicrobiaceae bacterium]